MRIKPNGSERQSKTQTKGKRQDEGINIKLDLLALGKVEKALGGDLTRKSEELMAESHTSTKEEERLNELAKATGGKNSTK